MHQKDNAPSFLASSAHSNGMKQNTKNVLQKVAQVRTLSRIKSVNAKKNKQTIAYILKMQPPQDFIRQEYALISQAHEALLHSVRAYGSRLGERQ